VFDRRKQRLEFERQTREAIEDVRPGFEAATAELRTTIDVAVAELSATSGAAARCPADGVRMQLARTKVNRRWWTLWQCPRCTKTYRPSDFPEATRAAGWK
jgi:hypothetical protein